MIGLDIIYPIASKVAYEKYFHIGKSYRFTSIKNMKNIINKIITKWLINNICYYLHINKNKNIHLRIYK